MFFTTFTSNSATYATRLVQGAKQILKYISFSFSISLYQYKVNSFVLNSFCKLNVEYTCETSKVNNSKKQDTYEINQKIKQKQKEKGHEQLVKFNTCQ